MGALLAPLLLATATAGAPTPTHVRFTAAGDFGATANTRGVLGGMADAGADLHLALGDLSYGTTGEEQAWCDLVTSELGVGTAFELLSGNHESNGLNGNINDFSACLPNQLPGLVGTYGRQYYVDVPQQDPLVRFVMISPNLGFPNQPQWNYPAGSARYQWTSDTIDDARAKGVPWVVVGMHKPCQTIGQYACDIGPALSNLMLEKKVDLVLHGHEHIYQRTKQLALGGGCTALPVESYEPACVADADSQVVKGRGTVFATVGTGGTPLRAINTADPEAGYFAASSGTNAQPSYGFADVDVTPERMLLRFVPTGSGTFTDQVTISNDPDAPPPNSPPTAAWTSTTDNLTATFDGRSSSDTDGSIAAWSWDLGDGTTKTGPQVSHDYARAGTYRVALTVTDDDGATATRSADVTVTAPPPPATTIALDGFDRTVSNGWGTAEVGGPWTVSGTAASRFSVSGSAARIQVPAGSSPAAQLGQVASTSARTTIEFSVDKLIEANYVAIVGRQVGTEQYVARLRLGADGGLRMFLLRGSGTQLGTTYTAPFAVVPGERYKLSVQVSGTSPTSLSAKVWRASEAEPTAWQRTATDATAALQAAGRVGVFSYLPSAAVNAPVTLAVHDLVVAQPQ